jgi:protein-tyrosine-phosphatase
MRDKKLNILFVCKHNIFRSQVAEAYFKKINKDKKIDVKSAGILLEDKVQNIIKIGKKFGLKLKGNPDYMKSEYIQWADIIIIVADDVPKEIFKYNKEYINKVIAWKISDVYGKEFEVKDRRIQIIKNIMKKVDELNKILERKAK